MRYLLLLVLFTAVSCSQKFYFVRHAEKAQSKETEVMFDASNPPLSAAGNARAELLKDKLSSKKIKHIFSTKYTRAISTVQPLADAENVPVQLYEPAPDSMDWLFGIKKGNVVVVGHSNTLADLINKFTGGDHLTKDLEDYEYDNLFIISRKKGKFTFQREKFGEPSIAVKK